MRRRGGRYAAKVGKSYGTPTANPPEPQALDDYTGFKVPLAKLKKDWQGLLTLGPDIRNPQDFLRGIKDNMTLPYSRPEPADTFVAVPLTWQDGSFMYGQDGQILYSEGLIPTAEEL